RRPAATQAGPAGGPGARVQLRFPGVEAAVRPAPTLAGPPQARMPRMRPPPGARAPGHPPAPHLLVRALPGALLSRARAAGAPPALRTPRYRSRLASQRDNADRSPCAG